MVLLNNVQLMQYMCLTMGTSVTANFSGAALKFGPLGSILMYVTLMAIFFIPLVYMESVIGQFTSRDCIDVWKIRPLLSHIGYVMILWQLMVVILIHVYTSFSLYYTLISTVSPMPFYTCGPWSKKSCNVVTRNYTVHQNCIRHDDRSHDYCENIQSTFTEFQYWKYAVLKYENVKETSKLTVSWNIVIMSAILCSIIFLSCFKKDVSMKWALLVITYYPLTAYIVLMFGVLMQRGIATWSAEVFDTSFSTFWNSFYISTAIRDVFFSMSIGSGALISLAGRTGFRSPSYNYTAISMIFSMIFCIISSTTVALAICPYSNLNNLPPTKMKLKSMMFSFEIIPYMFRVFSQPNVWLVLFYSSLTFLGLRATVVESYNLIMVMANRHRRIFKHQGLATLIYVVCLFLITIPLMSFVGIIVIRGSFRNYVSITSIFMVTLESFVFVIWYGPQNFFGDIHFMHGLKPSNYLKFIWMISGFVTGFIFIYSLYISWNRRIMTVYGVVGLMLTVGSVVFICLIKIIWSIYKKNWRELLALDPSWGPKQKHLMRSRAMFSAQALTKEYIYRQYHLQAGILNRQRAANVRRSWENEKRIVRNKLSSVTSSLM